jgi:3-hydroxyisobutyrate dehydrogenase-like beta-hydroxyacid dehydrogenase
MPERVGFIGVGRMGHGMAGNLLAKGFPLTVLGHRNRAPVADLVARGAREGTTARELAEGCAVVFLCVTGSPQVEALVYGEAGLLAGARPGFTLVDCSTSEPASTRRIAADLAARGAAMADAPVTRAPRDAEAGRLNSLVGASDTTVARIRPLLDAYSEAVFHFGPVGAGHTAKLVNNFITMGYCALIAEGMALCAAAGVDLRAMYQVLSRGAADSGALRKMIPAFLEGDLTGHPFALANALKDVTYAGALMADCGFDSRLVEAVRQTYAEAVAQGYGDRLMASLMELHEARLGTPVVPRRGAHSGA